MKDIIYLCALIGTMWSVLYFYKQIFRVIGLFGYKKFKPTENKHKYALCVPARNEEKVIKNFLDSVAESDYPLDKITVFVIADNCTDKTAEIAKNYEKNGLNVRVYEHNNPNERTKGFALKYFFERLQEDNGVDTFDGYFIFDADNVIRSNYLTKMNEAFDAGNKIIVSFRNSKNVNQNWISFGYAMHWMRTCLNENRAKGLLNQACRVQGTGFLFSNELVKDGWKYTSLTEDRSFCTDAVVQNYRITYCEEAVFYDEQPYKLKVALRQRVRWAKGHLQSAVENCPKLLRNMVSPKKNFFIAYDSFFLNFPRHIESGIRKLISNILTLALAIMAAEAGGLLFGVFVGMLKGAVDKWTDALFTQICVLILYRDNIEKNGIFKRLFHMLMFPFFDIIGKWSMYVALFKKVEWKPIPHDTVMDLDKLKK